MRMSAGIQKFYLLYAWRLSAVRIYGMTGHEYDNQATAAAAAAAGLPIANTCSYTSGFSKSLHFMHCIK
jgi:hypothetical protein